MLKRLLNARIGVMSRSITLFISAIFFACMGAYLAVEAGIKFFTTPEYRRLMLLVHKFSSDIDVFSPVLYIFAVACLNCSSANEVSGMAAIENGG